MAFAFPWGAKEASQSSEVSLDDILPTTASRVDLILLVALCTDTMRDGLSAVFEPPRDDTQVTASTDLLLLDDDDEVANQRRDLAMLRRAELSSAEMQGLKRVSVNFLNAWRTAVLTRMGESLKVRPDAVKQAKAKYVSTREAEARAKKDSDFFAWAEGIDNQFSPKQERPSASHAPFPYETIPTKLASGTEKQRGLILNACLFMFLSLETYPAHSRTLMLYLCHCLRLPTDVLISAEATLAMTLIKSAASQEMNTDQARKQKAASDASSKKWKVGLATVGGAVLVGVTGGLAAPLLLGVAGSIMGGIGLGGLATLLGATIANPITVAALFGTLGGRMSGKAMEEFAKEVRDFKLIPIRRTDQQKTMQQASDSPVAPTHKLRVAIGISGWVLDESDVSKPWRVFSSEDFESFALRYEQDALIKLATTLDNVLRESAFTLAQAGAMHLALPAIAAAMLPVSLLSAGQFLDNPFSIAMERSDKAGKVLAAALMSKAQGERSVTLIGFSLGSRVIFSCLQELSDQKAFGLVENVILAGSPVTSSEMPWRKIRAVVTGRVVNVYTTRDLLLGFLYRTRNLQLNVAGLEPIKTVERIENYDVSDIVKGHNQYRLAMGTILKTIHFEGLNDHEVSANAAELHAEDEMEQEVHHRAQAEGRLRNDEDEDGRIVMIDAAQASEGSKRPSLDEVAPTTPIVMNDTDTTPKVQHKLPLRSKAEAPLFLERRSDDRADREEESESEDEFPQMSHIAPEPM